MYVTAHDAPRRRLAKATSPVAARSAPPAQRVWYVRGGRLGPERAVRGTTTAETEMLRLAADRAALPAVRLVVHRAATEPAANLLLRRTTGLCVVVFICALAALAWMRTSTVAPLWAVTAAVALIGSGTAPWAIAWAIRRGGRASSGEMRSTRAHSR